MSKMSQISMEIQDRLDTGDDPKQIAKDLEVPLTWVYATMELQYSQYNEYDPYNTINS